MKTLRYISVCVLAVVFATSHASFALPDSIPESKKVILFLNFLDINSDSDESPSQLPPVQGPKTEEETDEAENTSSNRDTYFGDPEMDFHDFEKRMRSQFPDRPIRKVITNDIHQGKKLLAEVLKEDEKISHLYFFSHGASAVGSLDGRTYSKVLLSIGNRGLLIIHHLDGTSMEDELNQAMNREVIDFFSGIRGRFSSDSMVLFESCSLFQYGKIRETAKLLSYALGQTNGILYGNKTYGVVLPYFKRPFFFEKKLDRFIVNGLVQTVVALNAYKGLQGLYNREFNADQLSLLLLGLGIYDYFVTYNKGYLFHFNEGSLKLREKIKLSDYKKVFFGEKRYDLDAQVKMIPATQR